MVNDELCLGLAFIVIAGLSSYWPSPSLGFLSVAKRLESWSPSGEGIIPCPSTLKHGSPLRSDVAIRHSFFSTGKVLLCFWVAFVQVSSLLYCCGPPKRRKGRKVLRPPLLPGLSSSGIHNSFCTHDRSTNIWVRLPWRSGNPFRGRGPALPSKCEFRIQQHSAEDWK